MKLMANRVTCAAFLATEAVVAMGILTAVALPLAYGFLQAPRRIAADYQRTVLLELVDGEAEILAAGAGRVVSDGSHPWTLRGASITNLPPGKTTFVRAGAKGRLEWRAQDERKGRPVIREFLIQDPARSQRQP